jgi:hypothetical protein
MVATCANAPKPSARVESRESCRISIQIRSVRQRLPQAWPALAAFSTSSCNPWFHIYCNTCDRADTYETTANILCRRVRYIRRRAIDLLSDGANEGGPRVVPCVFTIRKSAF